MQRQLAELLEELRGGLLRRAFQVALVQLVQRRIAAIAVADTRGVTEHVLQRRLTTRRLDTLAVATFMSFSCGR